MIMRAAREDRGSLPIALLAVLVVGALMAVVTGTVITGQKQTAFDQNFEQALTVAEVGLGHLMAQIEADPDIPSPLDAYAGADQTVPGSSATWRGRAEKNASGDWVIEATGTGETGATRTVETRVEIVGLFNVAAYGKFFADFNGGNGADSYRSSVYNANGTWTEQPDKATICDKHGNPTGPSSNDIVMCWPTYNGVVATNGELKLKGNTWPSTDYAEIHFAKEKIPDPLPDATGYCKSQGAACPSEFTLECDLREAPGVKPGTTVPKLQYCRDPIELPEDPVVPPSNLTSLGEFTGTGSNLIPQGEQLYTDVTLNENTVIQGTPEDPSIVYLTGKLTIPNQHHVNFQDYLGSRIPRPAPTLLIFSAGTGPALNFGNHASFAGAIYAPNASFAGGAQGNVYGSMVASSINNNGGWNFHYDDALGDVTINAPIFASNWVER